LQQKRPEAAAAATAVVGNFEIPSQSSKSPTTNSSALATKPLPLSAATIYNKPNKQRNTRLENLPLFGRGLHWTLAPRPYG